MRQEERHRGEQQTSQLRTTAIPPSTLRPCSKAAASIAVTAIAWVPQPQAAMDEIRQAELDSHTFTGCTQQSPVRRLRIVEVFVEFVAEYVMSGFSRTSVVSGFSRTSTVSQKADTTCGS
jgi:hypothetical protein